MRFPDGHFVRFLHGGSIETTTMTKTHPTLENISTYGILGPNQKFRSYCFLFCEYENVIKLSRVKNVRNGFKIFLTFLDFQGIILWHCCTSPSQKISDILQIPFQKISDRKLLSDIFVSFKNLEIGHFTLLLCEHFPL